MSGAEIIRSGECWFLPTCPRDFFRPCPVNHLLDPMPLPPPPGGGGYLRQDLTSILHSDASLGGCRYDARSRGRESFAVNSPPPPSGAHSSGVSSREHAFGNARRDEWPRVGGGGRGTLTNGLSGGGFRGSWQNLSLHHHLCFARMILDVRTMNNISECEIHFPNPFRVPLLFIPLFIRKTKI